jgi:DNA invertase Pin-like site-specific DNA recombinase
MLRTEIRSEWISYLRVSTAEQAERDLSLPAQRRAIEEYAARHGASIAREYLEAGCSGMSTNRKAFRKMLEDVFRPGSTVGTVVVQHTSRFTRDSTEARLVKQRFRKAGVRILSVCQETTEDPIGKLIEGIFECIDQYESEVNGMRTSLAMREAVRQGFFPSSWTPFGFHRTKVEIRPDIFRSVLEPDEDEATIVRELFHAYVAGSGAKSVAIHLNERGLFYRRGQPWSRNRVLHVLDEPALAGTYYWGRWSTKRKTRKQDADWIALPVAPIVTPALHELAMKLRRDREPLRNPGRPVSPANLLAGLVRCGKCGARYQLETSGKRVKGDLYQYRYYNCSKFCRVGRTVCLGYRIRTTALDSAVLSYLASIVCAPERYDALASATGARVCSEDLTGAWRTLVADGTTVSRNYVLHLIERVEVRENEIRVLARGDLSAPTNITNENGHLNG